MKKIFALTALCVASPLSYAEYVDESLHIS